MRVCLVIFGHAKEKVDFICLIETNGWKMYEIYLIIFILTLTQTIILIFFSFAQQISQAMTTDQNQPQQAQLDLDLGLIRRPIGFESKST